MRYGPFTLPESEMRSQVHVKFAPRDLIGWVPEQIAALFAGLGKLHAIEAREAHLKSLAGEAK